MGHEVHETKVHSSNDGDVICDPSIPQLTENEAWALHAHLDFAREPNAEGWPGSVPLVSGVWCASSRSAGVHVSAQSASQCRDAAPCGAPGLKQLVVTALIS